MTNQQISVCVISKPDENTEVLEESLAKQSYPAKEIIILKEIGRFSELRNKVMKNAKGDIIAFIDADCYAEKHWLEEMNNAFQDESIIGVWGKVCYELNGKMPTISTRIISNDGQGVATANGSFRADILKRVRFDEEFNAAEDCILDRIMKKEGKVIYSDNLIVFHTLQRWTFSSVINHAKKIEDNLLADFKYQIPIRRSYFIIHPEHYLILLFPPLVLIINSIRSFKDIEIAFGNYIEKVYTRLLIWKFAIKHKIFLI